ncbi:MAG: hypothetical protein PHZ04_05630 [Patescibacteria group bacterium]|nr:hypothetical protein [Patescibacteria group bacterium]MDD5295215.1 hypothetical protein [Patescibacteria group bacterium]MDD5554951.1 hypothetical protein [Patescibacteria group bacterium]
MTNTNTKTQKEFCENKIEPKRSGLFNFKNLNRFLFVVIVVAGVYYLTGINDLTVKGFKLQEEKGKVNLLKEENIALELKKNGLESYNNLSERAKELKMVAAGEIDYITVQSGIVAKK